MNIKANDTCRGTNNSSVTHFVRGRMNPASLASMIPKLISNIKAFASPLNVVTHSDMGHPTAAPPLRGAHM